MNPCKRMSQSNEQSGPINVALWVGMFVQIAYFRSPILQLAMTFKSAEANFLYSISQCQYDS